MNRRFIKRELDAWAERTKREIYRVDSGVKDEARKDPTVAALNRQIKKLESQRYKISLRIEQRVRRERVKKLPIREVQKVYDIRNQLTFELNCLVTEKDEQRFVQRLRKYITPESLAKGGKR